MTWTASELWGCFWYAWKVDIFRMTSWSARAATGLNSIWLCAWKSQGVFLLRIFFPRRHFTLEGFMKLSDSEDVLLTFWTMQTISSIIFLAASFSCSKTPLALLSHWGQLCGAVPRHRSARISIALVNEGKQLDLRFINQGIQNTCWHCQTPTAVFCRERTKIQGGPGESAPFLALMDFSFRP